MGELISDHLGSSQVAAALVYAKVSFTAWRRCQQLLSNDGNFLAQQCIVAPTSPKTVLF